MTNCPRLCLRFFRVLFNLFDRNITTILTFIKSGKRAFAKEATIYYSDIHRSEYEAEQFGLAFDDKSLSLRFSLVINTPMQWPFSRPVFAGIYSGSSDRKMTKISKQQFEFLHILNKHMKFSIISVIGGGYVLDLIREFNNLDKIIFFDENVNEFVKLCDLFNALKVSPDIDYQDAIENNSDYYKEFLVPRPRNGKITIFTEIADSLVNSKAVGPEYFPIIEKKKDYPERAAKFNYDEQREIGIKLEKFTSNIAFCDIPRIKFNGSLPILFLSNISSEYYDNQRIERLITSKLGIIIIRSNASEIYIRLNHHEIWNVFLSKYLIGTSHHLWNRSELKKKSFDPSSQIGHTWSFLGDQQISIKSNTLILHFPFTRTKDKCDVVISKLTTELSTIPTNLKRIIWCDYFIENDRHTINNLERVSSLLIIHGFKKFSDVLIPENLSIFRSSMLIFER